MNNFSPRHSAVDESQKLAMSSTTAHAEDISSHTRDAGARTTLEFGQRLRFRGLAYGLRSYLPWNRQHVFDAEQKAFATFAQADR